MGSSRWTVAALAALCLGLAACDPQRAARLEEGLSTGADVRRLLGKPAKTARYDLKPDEEQWEWRWLDARQAKLFTVTFDRDGRVLSSASRDDLSELHRN